MSRVGLVVMCFALAGCSAARNGGTGTGTATGGEPAPSYTEEDVVEALRAGNVAEALRRVEAAGGIDPELARVVRFLNGRPDDAVAMSPLLRRHLDRAMVNALVGLDPATPAGSWIATRLALLRLHTGELSRADVTGVRATVTGAHLHAALDRALALLNARASNQKGNRIGVLLPLSGPYRRLGEAALRALKQAVGRKVKLVVKDTKGDADRAAAMVDRLVDTHGVVGIIGPIGAFESSAAGRRAQQLGVPILVLSAREQIAGIGTRVFRSRTPPTAQGRQLARHAVHEIGIRRFGILISDSPYGWALAAGFWDEVTRLGADVNAVEVYPRGTKAWRTIVQRLVRGKKGTRATLDFEGLLIADGHSAVRKIAPFFPFYGVRIRRNPAAKRALQLMGGDAWNHPNIIDEAEQQTDNAIFCASFFPDESDGKIERFVNRFYAKHREAPTTFEAEVFDAASILRKAVGKGGKGGRAGVLEALTAMKSHRGVTGRTKFDDAGDGVRDVVLLTVHKDVIRPRVSEGEERVLRR